MMDLMQLASLVISVVGHVTMGVATIVHLAMTLPIECSMKSIILALVIQGIGSNGIHLYADHVMELGIYFCFLLSKVFLVMGMMIKIVLVVLKLSKGFFKILSVIVWMAIIIIKIIFALYVILQCNIASLV